MLDRLKTEDTRLKEAIALYEPVRVSFARLMEQEGKSIDLGWGHTLITGAGSRYVWECSGVQVGGVKISMETSDDDRFGGDLRSATLHVVVSREWASEKFDLEPTGHVGSGRLNSRSVGKMAEDLKELADEINQYLNPRKNIHRNYGGAGWR